MRENVVTPERVRDEPAFDEVNASAHQPLKFLMQVKPRFQPGRRAVERHQNVNVTVRAEIVAERGAKERELRDPPPAAQLYESILGNGERHGHG